MRNMRNAGDVKVSSSAKYTVLTENDDVLSSKFESESANYTVEQLKHPLSVGVSNRREKGKTYSHM